MKTTLSLYMDESLVRHFERECRKYAGSKSQWGALVLRTALSCISEVGFDEFAKRLKVGPKAEGHSDIDGI